ncbi:MAG: hypothetical protein ACPL1B_00515 [Thermoprotei archaeon]|jgi:putative serine/threonine protein kinase
MRENSLIRVYGGLKIKPLSFDDPRLLKLICYPSIENCNIKAKILELKELGIRPCIGGRVELHGGLQVLGKGTTSIVTFGLINNSVVALKILRCDSNRESLEREAKILQLVNNVGVGPKLILYSKNFLVIEFVKGRTLDEILLNGSFTCISRTLDKLFLQCFKLDSIGIDHGELSTPKKHIYVYRCNPIIIDFETASFSRRPSNLTAIIGHVFFKKTLISERIRSLFKLDNLRLQKLRENLKLYKEKPNYEQFLVIKSIIFTNKPLA